MPARPARKPRLSTALSPFYQQWVVINLIARPFQANFGSRFGLNLTDWRVMLTIADRPGITASELADYTGLDKMTISRVVRGLESRGELSRVPSPDDRRRRHLELTEHGWSVYQRIAKAAAVRESQVYDVLSAGESRQLHGLLTRLAERARSAE